MGNHQSCINYGEWHQGRVSKRKLYQATHNQEVIRFGWSVQLTRDQSCWKSF